MTTSTAGYIENPILLIVDDTPDNISMLKAALDANYTIRPALNGELALKLAELIPQPDLILLDIIMPNMDGYEVCQRLKANPKTADIPVIFITAKNDTNAELHGLALGAVDYITKPFSPHIVQARVKNHLLLNWALQEVKEKNLSLQATLDHLSASEERFRSLVHTIPDIVYKIDPQGYFTFLNPAILKMGFQPSELIGHHFSTLLHPNECHRVCREQVLPTLTGQSTGTTPPKLFDERRTRQRQTNGLELFLKNKIDEKNDKQFIFSEINSSGLYQHPFDEERSETPPELIGSVGVIRDITERQLTLMAIKAAKEKAEESTRLKDKFVALVAHDLRSPLSSILGLLEYILDDPDNSIAKLHRKLLQSAIESGRHLTTMIEEVLNIGRLQSGKLVVNKLFFDLHHLIQDTLQTMEHLLSMKNIHCHNQVPVGTRVAADRDLLGEVLQNLISNAIKFSWPGGSIYIYIPTEEDENFILSVSDQGVGIPQEVIPKLFDIGEKISTPGTNDERGTGFGLPFSFDIMQAHQGNLSVISEVGKGSIFSLSLPEIVPNILIVDDEPHFRTLIQRALFNLNLTIFEAENGQQAWIFLQEMPIHLIISDLHMPNMNGYQLLEKIKKNPATRKIPFILVTGDRDEQLRDRAFQIGVADFCQKPLQLYDFIPRVRHLLNR
ncbi:MAG: response regulator [Magnetococcus sp. DMHC-6]